jgi:hypothetical protein
MRVCVSLTHASVGHGDVDALHLASAVVGVGVWTRWGRDRAVVVSYTECTLTY